MLLKLTDSDACASLLEGGKCALRQGASVQSALTARSKLLVRQQPCTMLSYPCRQLSPGLLHTCKAWCCACTLLCFDKSD